VNPKVAFSSLHDGVDIQTQENVDVYACEGGRIIWINAPD
jgi:murein DD-endopeptidase MepM/ murein hydrolase activator NlpD